MGEYAAGACLRRDIWRNSGVDAQEAAPAARPVANAARLVILPVIPLSPFNDIAAAQGVRCRIIR